MRWMAVGDLLDGLAVGDGAKSARRGRIALQRVQQADRDASLAGSA